MKLKLELIAYIISIIVVIVILLYAVNLIYGGLRFTQRREVRPTEPYAEIVQEEGEKMMYIVNDTVYLPLPRKITNVSVEEVILWRRSIRDYTLDPLTIEQLSMLLWSAYGVTETRWEFRAAPSAGATYPLEIYVVIGEKCVVINSSRYLEAGVYKYDVYTHTIKLIKKGDVRKELAKAALNQPWVEEAPINIIITAVFERTTRVYGTRGAERYVPMEVGHVGQNVYLMATALRLGTVVVGAFYDNDVARIIAVPKNEIPMYIIPVGVPEKFRETQFEEIHVFIENNRRRG